MWVHLLTGRYAGEERDVRPDQAKVMLADGRAQLPAYVGIGAKPLPEPKPVQPNKRNRGRSHA
jgi:hypothetical protein